jgi:hypothetical protein
MIIFFRIIFILLSSSSLLASDLLLFEKIHHVSLSGVGAIIESDEWQDKKDDQNRSILRAALEKMADIHPKKTNKILSIIREIISNNKLEIANDDIEYFLNNFFKIDNNNIFIKNNKKDVKFAKKLILSVFNLEEKDRINNIKNISKIIDLFCKRDSVALAIISLFQKNRLNKQDVTCLLEHYYSLFLQENLPSNKMMNNIIKSLLPLEHNKYLLKIMLDAYEKKLVNKKNKKASITHGDEYYMSRKTDKNGMNTEDVANVMTYLDIHDFAKLSPRKIFHSIGRKSNSISLIMARQEGITKFIVQTILYPRNDKNRDKNYKYWTKIYAILKEKGNLQGALSVALALDDSKLNNFMQKNRYVKRELIKYEDNLKIYREAQATFLDNHIQPALAFLIKDLTLMKEAASSVDNIANFIIQNSKWYLEKRTFISDFYNFNKNFNVVERSALIDIFKSPSSNDDKKTCLFAKDYNFLMPKIKISKANPYRDSLFLNSARSENSLYQFSNPQQLKRTRSTSLNKIKININTANFVKEAVNKTTMSPRKNF